MQPKDRQFEGTCARLYIEFFEKFPNDELRDAVSVALALLLKRQRDFPGEPGGWAGGIVYAVGTIGCGVPGVLNADLEKAFGTTMGTIRWRAEQVRQILALDMPRSIQGIVPPREFTLRDEANAICAYAFRNDPLFEAIHEENRITDAEMKTLMVSASAHLAKLMAMKQESPEKYDRFIREYHGKFCLNWER
ncbi:MAG: hypothetical protein ACE15C_16390 [Phycisphaerae bacterium]